MSDNSQPTEQSTAGLDFIRKAIIADNKNGRFGGVVHTRFPPEPNGYLHIGHAKSICLNFGLAPEFGGVCNLRFDDTNPTKEERHYVEAIAADVRWLGFDPAEKIFYASDYFEKLYEYAVALIEQGKAYVCDLTPEEMRRQRGTLTAPGTESPFRNRPIAENLSLFSRMRQGGFPDGACSLRAKIDMAAPNLNLRDPVMYRIMHAAHHRTASRWCIYPTYDFAHGYCDSIEGITHSICTLEFENHRPLYDWFLAALSVHHPRQIEFARLNLTYTVMSKRQLLLLVRQGHVRGWDDPRLPTIAGLRRRGYTAAAIRLFCERIGVAKFNSTVEIEILEQCLREELNQTAPRAMAVIKPLRLIIDNYPADQVEQLPAINNPEDPGSGQRLVPFSRELYIERDDVMEHPAAKFYRLSPGREVRLRYAYFVTCQELIKDPASGDIVAVHCTYDPQTRGGNAPDGRKVKATIHWVSAAHALQACVRLYDRLFTARNPDAVSSATDITATLNPESLVEITNARIEPALRDTEAGRHVQFERLGYFCADAYDHSRETPVFNRCVGLRDAWAKAQQQSRVG